MLEASQVIEVLLDNLKPNYDDSVALKTMFPFSAAHTSLLIQRQLSMAPLTYEDPERYSRWPHSHEWADEEEPKAPRLDVFCQEYSTDMKGARAAQKKKEMRATRMVKALLKKFGGGQDLRKLKEQQKWRKTFARFILEKMIDPTKRRAFLENTKTGDVVTLSTEPDIFTMSFADNMGE